MKKIIALVILLCMCATLTSCLNKTQCREIIFTENYKDDINEIGKEHEIQKVVVAYAAKTSYKEWYSPNEEHANGTICTFKGTAWLISYELTELHSPLHSFMGSGTYIFDEHPPIVTISDDICYVEYTLHQISTFKNLGEGMTTIQIYYK